MKKLLLSLSVISLLSCTKQTIHQSPCDGNCDTHYDVIYENQIISPNSNGYYEVDYSGLNYFQVKGRLTPVNNQYVVNGVPLVEAKFDSDYWVVFDSILFQTPMYSYLGWFNDQTLETPISIGNNIYTLTDLIQLMPPLNIVGYQIPYNFDVDHPAAESYLGTYSRYNYNPTQNIFVDNEMVGDTINIFIETTFNVDMGESDVILDNIKVIII